MEVIDRPLTIDDIWRLQRQPEYQDKHLELIDGQLVIMPPFNLFRSWLAHEIAGYFRAYLQKNAIGYNFIKGGFYPADDRNTLLGPDIAFLSKDRVAPPFPQTFTGLMPDLAVEIASPSNTRAELRRKAAIYLRNGSRLVWLALPDEKAVEVCRLAQDGQITIEFIGRKGQLSGDDVLPGFTLELRQLFP